MLQLLSFVREHPFLAGAAALATYLLVSFVWTGYQVRSRFRGLPGPPHHWLWGHIPILLQLFREVPPQIAPLYYADLIREKYNLGDVYYFDLWPVGLQFLMIVDPDITNQLIIKDSTHKHSLVKLFMKFLVGSSANLLSDDGHSWVRSRRVFNPAFASSHLNTLIPDIVEECAVFCDILERHARDKDVFRLEEAATLLSIDVIGRAILDKRLHSQSTENELAVAILDQAAWIPQARPNRPWEILNPVFLVRMWWNNRKMDAYLGKVVEERFAAGHSGKTTKNVIDLALDAQVSEKGDQDSRDAAVADAEFKKTVFCQLKTLMFAGHDTVSGTVCYAYHLLHRNPEKLAKIRQEHDAIFGNDPDDAANMIKAQPNILNKLEYTAAVLKETLRLYPPASTLREGADNLFIKDPQTGAMLPTKGFAVSPTTIGMHRHPKHFPNPHAFMPERFTVNGAAPSSSSNPAYLPFSRGPRICIGQELAVIEMKIILAMTVRRFDIRAAFEDVNLLKPHGSHWPSDNSGKQEVYGDEAYQIMLGSAKPREGMPARVKLVAKN